MNLPLLKHLASFNGYALTDRAKKRNRKNGKGRLFKTITFYKGPAKDANQKTTVTKHFAVTENLHF